MGNMKVLSPFDLIQPAEGTAQPGGKEGVAQSAAAEFAAILGGWLQAYGLNGQNVTEDQPGNSLSSDNRGEGWLQVQAGEEGLKRLALLKTSLGLFSSPVLSELPAGKDANSGEKINDLPGKLLDALVKGDVERAWTALSSGGVSLDGSELDEYRVKIFTLLQELSGELTTAKPEKAEQIRQLQAQLIGLGLLTDQAPGEDKGKAVNGQFMGQPATQGNGISGQPGIQAAGQSIEQPVDQLTGQTNERPIGQTTGQSSNQPVGQSGGQPVSTPTGHPANQLAGQTTGQSAEQAGGQSVVPTVEEEPDLVKVLPSALSQIGPKPDHQGAKLAYGLGEERGYNGNVPLTQQESLDGKTAAGEGKGTTGPLTAVQSGTLAQNSGNGEMKGDSQTSSSPHLVKNEGEQDGKMIPPYLHAPEKGEGAHRTLTTPAPLHNAPVWEQVLYAMREAANSRPQLKQLSIRLSPAELGNIHISMSWEDGLVHLQCKASHPGTGQALQDTMNELRNALENMGISCGSMEAGLSDGQEQTFYHEQERERIIKGLPEESPEFWADPTLTGNGMDESDQSDETYRVNVKV